MSQTLVHDHSTGTSAATGPRGASGTGGVPVREDAPVRRGPVRHGAAGRRPRALAALVASGALLVGLFGGFGLGRATAPDPFAGMVQMRSGAPADGTTLPAAPPGTTADGTSASGGAAASAGTAGATGTAAPDLTTHLGAGRTGPAVYLTAGLVSATTAPTTREPLTA